MTRKDYKLIANVIINAWNNIPLGQDETIVQAIYDDFVTVLGKELNFNCTKFDTYIDKFCVRQMGSRTTKSNQK